MQPEALLLAERLVVAIECISGNVDRMSISLNDIKSSISYLVAEKRCTEMPGVSNISKPISEVTTHPTPASSFGEEPVYVGSANAPPSGDEDENFMTGEEPEQGDEIYFPVVDATPVNSCVFFPSAIKEESIDEDENLEMSSRNQFNESAMVREECVPADSLDVLRQKVGESGEIIRQIKQEQISEEYVGEPSVLQSASNVINIPLNINNPGSSHDCAEFPSSTSTLQKGNASLQECLSYSTLKKRGSALLEIKKKELLHISSRLIVAEMKTGDGKSATDESAKEQMEAESEMGCTDARKEGRNLHVGKRSQRRAVRRCSSQNANTMQTQEQAKKKSLCCTVCGKRCNTRQLLERHSRVHTGERPFKCSKCNKSFTQKSNLDTHMRIHTGNRPFRCSVCGMTFTQNINLHTHMMHHTKEKPFNCNECKRAFSRKCTLIRHTRTHTGEMPFKCRL